MYNFGGQRINEGGLRGSPRSQETKKKPSLNRVNDPIVRASAILTQISSNVSFRLYPDIMQFHPST